jgi:hypothetical protein
MPEQETEIPTFEPIFYTLPVERLEVGMSTEDGQDVLATGPVYGDPSLRFADVYTRRSDDDELDAENRRESGYRLYNAGERVGLAVFSDTDVDSSDLPEAVITSTVRVTLERE